MGQQDRLAAMTQHMPDRRRDGAQARVVGDAAILDRGVDVDADQDAATRKVEAVQGAELHQKRSENGICLYII